jgi:dolichol-phosphate mannosyltransferase
MKIAVIIPCYRVRDQLPILLDELLTNDYWVYCVDDQCPEKTGEFITQNFQSPRLTVLTNPVNLGVGGAVKNGWKKALEDGCDIFVKLDGDGQMRPSLIPGLISPLLAEEADFSKGNRFYTIEDLKKMPTKRLIGNSILSFVNKFVHGYWGVMDPTNGFVAINKIALSMLPLDLLDNSYFFESDLLFRLGTIRAVVNDFPMQPVYNDEPSSLSIRRVFVEFPPKYFVRIHKRLFYIYFLRDFNIGSLQLVFGNLLFWFGVIFGAVKWVINFHNDIATPTGTIMIAVLPIILGFQLLLSFLNYDISNVPRKSLKQFFHLKDFK